MMNLNCLEQARVGIPHEHVSHRNVLITTMRYRTGCCNQHYLPGALDRMVERVKRSGVYLDKNNDRAIDFVEAVILDEEAAARMAIDRIVGSGWNNWTGMAGGMV